MKLKKIPILLLISLISLLSIFLFLTQKDINFLSSNKASDLKETRDHLTQTPFSNTDEPLGKTNSNTKLDSSESKDSRAKAPPSSSEINDKLLQSLQQYLVEIKNQTGVSIGTDQREQLLQYIRSTKIYNLPKSTQQEHRKEFDKIRKSLIKQWQEQTGLSWPKYEKPIVEKGKVVRSTGQNYDAHHIIELSWNGPNTWWNLTPAAYPDQHQQGIHRAGGLASVLFSYSKERYDDQSESLQN